MAQIQKLTIQQEKDILQYIVDHEVSFDNISYGSSRVVLFPNEENMKKICELAQVKIPFDFVIKIALGEGGYNQSQREITSYEKHGDSYPLGEIYAYGAVLEFMVRVEPVDEMYRNYDGYDCEQLFNVIYHSDDDNWSQEDYYRDDEDKAKIREHEFIWSAMCSLEDLFGVTGDNGQVGIDSNGHYVAYDYGFDAGSSESEVWSSSIGDSCITTEILRDYLLAALRGLNKYQMDELEFVSDVAKFAEHDYL